jgi:hypothetical protein
VGSSGLGSSNILLHNPEEKWQITQEDVICLGIYIALCCDHHILLMHLLESAAKPKKSTST